ncbi:hypothetical protein HK104_009567 [Borealophlyctis nickersoniae]|nr:hypothetical protein HK104_009567 [Borealophlyctis nickersoniae]
MVSLASTFRQEPLRLALLSLVLASPAVAFYLPGVAPNDFVAGESVPLYVNSLSSPDTVLPYDYYLPQFHFCVPEGGPQDQKESLGSVLFGDRLHSSAFDLKMKEDESCKVLCKQTFSAEDAKFVNDRIKEEYYLSWIVDGLPAARVAQDARTGESYYNVGVDLGSITEEDGRPYLNNHWEIVIDVHTVDSRVYRVVGVLVTPLSIANLEEGKDCRTARLPSERLYLSEETGKQTEVTWSYSVTWKESSTPWGTRWDNYLHVFDPKIHWFSLVNSVVIVLFLTGMVAMILLRALHKDIARYNALEAQEDAQEDFGWKLVHGDVFRPPVKAMLLSVFLGNGVQLLLMTSVTFAGYTSARLYKMFHGENWKRNVIMTAFLLPGVIFTLFIILNFFLVGAKSSGAVPFGTMFALFSMWFLVSAPLCFVGAYFGFKKPRIEHPVRTNQIPRQIPEQPFYLRKLPSALTGGILPFGAIFIELYFIMNSIWFHRIYYVFGFLFIVFLILILTCSEVTILMCYFHLCGEDYHWWWRAFLTSGASAFYVFLYGAWYYYTRLTLDDAASTVLYFGWTFVMSLLFFVLTGTIGFFACFMFVRKIYASIKID